MAVTSPDNIWTPDAGDDYALTVDLAATADTVQDALNEIHDVLDPIAEDTGWVDLALSSGYSVQSGRTPQARRIGKVLFIRGMITRTPGFATSTVYNDVATYPGSMIPDYNYDRQLSAQSANATVRGWVSSTSGALVIVTGSVAPTYIDLSGLSGAVVD